MAELRAGAPYQPELYFNCEDASCCWNYNPHAWCLVCHEEWPCTDYRKSHTEVQVRAQLRWMARKWVEEGDDRYGQLSYSVDSDWRDLKEPKSMESVAAWSSSDPEKEEK